MGQNNPVFLTIQLILPQRESTIATGESKKTTYSLSQSP